MKHYIFSFKKYINWIYTRKQIQYFEKYLKGMIFACMFFKSQVNHVVKRFLNSVSVYNYEKFLKKFRCLWHNSVWQNVLDHRSQRSKSGISILKAIVIFFFEILLRYNVWNCKTMKYKQVNARLHSLGKLINLPLATYQFHCILSANILFLSVIK